MIKQNPPLIESKNIYDYIKSDAQAIAFEVASTISSVGGRYVSKQNPKCYEWFNRFFGKQWTYVLGAMMLSYGCKNDRVMPHVVLPVGYVYRKLLLAYVIKPSIVIHESNGYLVSEAVKDIEQNKEYPGYLARTKKEDITIAASGLMEFALKSGLTKIVVSPPFVTDNYITADEATHMFADILDSRFVIAKGGF